MSTRSSNSSEAMVKFLKERVEANQGIALQELTGHLSQLSFDLRAAYGGSVKSLKAFLQKFPDVFAISKHSKVYVRTKSRHATSSLTGSAESFEAKTTGCGTDEKDGTCLTDVKGTVYRIFSVYGFISIEDPIKTSVYFDVKSFENGEHTTLPSSGLQVGEWVIFDAKVGPRDCEARFRASRVVRTSMTELSSSPRLSPKSTNDGGGGGGGDCDTTSCLVNQLGMIETVKSKFGFIKFGQNQRERAFFHANDIVDKSLGKAIKNLPDLFSVGDKVRFSAKPSKKPSDKVKWQATIVSLCRNSDGTMDFEDELGKEVFWSDDESDDQDSLLAKLHESKNSEAGFESPVGGGDWEARSIQTTPSFNSSEKGKKLNARPVLSEWESKQKLSGERGFFFPVTESLGTIKFGPDRGLTACAAVEVTYRDEERIDNLVLEVADDQEVCFDAVEAEDNRWIATLVWIGQRPAKPLLGVSENVSGRSTKKRRGAQKPSLNAGPKPRGDFGGEESLQSVRPGSEPNFQPAETSTPKYKRDPAAPEVSYTSEAYPNSSFLSAGEDDDVLLRFAKMVAVEVVAEKERMRLALHDVGVQTDDEAPFPSPHFSPDGFVSSRVSSSTQTSSTGEIE